MRESAYPANIFASQHRWTFPSDLA